MSETTVVTSVTGTDGVVVVFDPNARWTQWALSEVYMGGTGAGRYVPKVGDYVIDTDTDERYRVFALDATSLVPTLKVISDKASSGEFSDVDVLLGVGPGTQSDTYRVYIDKSVIPHVLAVDARLRVAGTTVTHAKIFRGSTLDGTAKVISAMYDQSGTLVGQNLPLELAAANDVTNYTIKSVKVGYTTEDLPDGEVVTAVFYDADGTVVSKRQLLVENTAFIRSTDSATKYIIDIALETPFLSDSDPTLVQYPLNLMLSSFSLHGVVTYSDGTSLRMPVDGTKFQLFGLENYVSTIIGQPVPLTLKYNLSPDEIVYGATSIDGKFKTKSYRAITTKADGAYSVKLFGYPVWIDAVNGYRLEWFLFNLDRQTWKNVTPYVAFNENSPAYNPVAYGASQRLSVSINLNDVNALYKKYVHTQTIDINLVRQGSDHSSTNWTIGFDPGQNPPFGRSNYAALTFINQNLRKVKIDQGETNQTTWLARMYGLTKPLFDPSKEVEPLVPNMFSLVFGNEEVEFAIEQWADELTFSNAIADSQTLFIKFFRRMGEDDLQLAMSALPVYQVN